MSDSNNNSVIIHAAVELIVVSGVALWLSRRVARAEERLFLAEEKLRSHDQQLQQCRAYLQRHDETIHSLAPKSDARPKRRKAPKRRIRTTPATDDSPGEDPLDDDVGAYLSSEIAEIRKNCEQR